MFSKLIFKKNNLTVEFHLHEVVSIAQQIIKTTNTEEVLIPTTGMFEEFLNILVSNGIFENDNVINGEHDIKLLLPLHIRDIDTVGKWLYVAKRLNDNHHFESLRGWWLNISERLLLIKNQHYDYHLHLITNNKRAVDRAKKKLNKSKKLQENFLIHQQKSDNRWFVYGENYDGVCDDYDITDFINNKLPEPLTQQNFDRYEEPLLSEILSGRCLGHSQLFYISDHGFIIDILNQTTELVFQTAWTDPKFASVVKMIHHKLLSASNARKNNLKSKLAKLIQSAPISELQAFHPEQSKESLLKIKQNATDEKYKNDTWNNFSESNLYINNALIDKLNDLKNHECPNLINRIYSDNPPDRADLIIRYLVLMDLARDINKGKHEPLFRPISSYGKSKNRGDTYHSFGNSIKNYFKKREHLTPQQLATQMRHILKGRIIDTEDLTFLPNLIGAWFVAEVIRNSSSLITGLMLVDMIENGVELPDSSGNNWYSWENTVVHPKKNERNIKKVKDLYGSKINIDNFGGSHPMSHGGSVADANKTLEKKNNKLSVVRQKEGSLILHWLYLMLQNDQLGYEIEIVRAENCKPPPNPKYDEIAELNGTSKTLAAKSKKLSKHQGTIRVKQKEDANANIKKETDQIEKLKPEIARLTLKRHIQKTIIEPYLKQRLATLNNLLSYEAIKQYQQTNSISRNQLAAAHQLTSWEKCNVGGLAILSSFFPDEDAMLQQAIQASLQQPNSAQQYINRKEMLAKVAATHGYQCHDVTGDGNCFFYAVAHQLKRIGRTGQDIDPDILRIVTAVEINSNRHRYLDFMQQHQRENFAAQTATSNTYVGMIAAQAIARIKNVILVIIPHDGGTPQAIKPASATEVIVLGNEVDIHFQSLIAIDPILNEQLPECATDSIQTIIDNTPTLDNNPPQLGFDSPFFSTLSRLHNEQLEHNRHDNPQSQRAYDQRFGLITFKGNPL